MASAMSVIEMLKGPVNPSINLSDGSSIMEKSDPAPMSAFVAR